MSEGRVEQWKRKLLDLSMRNPLLNVRDGKKFLPLQKGGRYSNQDGTTAVVPYSSLEAGEGIAIGDAPDEKEVRKRLKELYAASRSMSNETGINSLFLAVGFLNWNEKDGEDLHHAPLILIPAQLTRQAAAPGYRLQRTDEDAVVNFCLMGLLSDSKYTVKVISERAILSGRFDVNKDNGIGEVSRFNAVKGGEIELVVTLAVGRIPLKCLK